MDVLTGIALNYLPKARILAFTLKAGHPEWRFHLCISDRNITDLKLKAADEPFDTIFWVEELDTENIYQWIFKHTVVEICTGIPGRVPFQ